MIAVTSLQIIAYIVCAFKYRKFASMHTFGNKVLGAAVFVFPFFLIGRVYLLYSLFIYIFGAIAFLGAIELNLILLLSKRYDPRIKTIFWLHRYDDESIGNGVNESGENA